MYLLIYLIILSFQQMFTSGFPTSACKWGQYGSVEDLERDKESYSNRGLNIS